MHASFSRYIHAGTCSYSSLFFFFLLAGTWHRLAAASAAPSHTAPARSAPWRRARQPHRVALAAGQPHVPLLSRPPPGVCVPRAAAEVHWGGHGACPRAARPREIGGGEWAAGREEPGSAMPHCREPRPGGSKRERAGGGGREERRAFKAGQDPPPSFTRCAKHWYSLKIQCLDTPEHIFDDERASAADQ